MSATTAVALIGFGEVGQLIARNFAERGAAAVSAWDIRFDDPDSGPRRAVDESSARRAANASDAVAGADLIISAVTAAECLNVAKAISALVSGSPYFLDLNSVAPETKSDAARLLEGRGARYVEAAVMSPIAPKGIASPILIGGPRAAEYLPVGQALGFTGTQVYSAVTGQASAAKMCRSVIIKGVEALLAESLISARRYGVEETVLSSLGGLLPAADWPKLARYMISRALEHGARRADEMREVALTVAGAGLDPWMSNACANRQDWCATLGDARHEESLAAMLDHLLAHIPDPRGEG